MSSPYGIYLRKFNQMILVNVGPEDDSLHVIVDVKPETIEIHDYYPGIEREIFGHTPPSSYYFIMFTANNGSVVTATYLFFDEEGKVKDYVASKSVHRSAFRMARIVLWCECIRNDRLEAVEAAVKTSKWGEEFKEEEEICAICHEEYDAEDMIGTLECNHSYHKECIKKWMMKSNIKNRNCPCPLCRANAFFLRRLCFVRYPQTVEFITLLKVIHNTAEYKDFLCALVEEVLIDQYKPRHVSSLSQTTTFVIIQNNMGSWLHHGTSTCLWKINLNHRAK